MFHFHTKPSPKINRKAKAVIQKKRKKRLVTQSQTIFKLRIKTGSLAKEDKVEFALVRLDRARAIHVRKIQ